MKTNTIYSLLALVAFALFMSSCEKEEKQEEKDPCEYMVCLNGGVCIDGTCDCPPPFTGANCETDTTTPDPCKGITCYNGGTCVNGVCNCPTGWTGPDCRTQVQPLSINVTKIEVTRFPPTDNGGGWDITSGPDIYTTLSYGSTTIFNAPTYFQNADPSRTYSWDPSPAISIDYPRDKYTIRLYDFDSGSADDFMGGIEFTPYAPNNNFPSILNLDAGGSVAFRIHINYVY